MIIKPNHPCKCGHAASWHEEERKSLDIDAIDPIVIVTRLYGKCDYNKQRSDSGDWAGVSFDYTNFGHYCYCQEFKLDNLKYLEQEANGH